MITKEDIKINAIFDREEDKFKITKIETHPQQGELLTAELISEGLIWREEYQSKINDFINFINQDSNRL